MSACEGADCAYSGAEEGRGVIVGENLERVAEKRTHLHHGFELAAEHGNVEEADVVAGEVEAAGSSEVDERSRGSGECTMPEIDEFAAAFVATAMALVPIATCGSETPTR